MTPKKFGPLTKRTFDDSDEIEIRPPYYKSFSMLWNIFWYFHSYFSYFSSFVCMLDVKTIFAIFDIVSMSGVKKMN